MLVGAAEAAVARRQVFDLPEIAVRVTEQMVARRCVCGRVTCGDAPAGSTRRCPMVTDTGAEHLWTTDPHGVWFRAGRSLGEAGLTAEARDYFQRLHAAVMDRVGPDHPTTLAPRHHLARWRGESGDAIGAAAAYQELLADTVRVFGPDHLTTLTTRRNLAYWRGESGDAVGAVAAFEELLADAARVFGPDHPTTLTIHDNLTRWRNRSRGTSTSS